MDGSFIPPPFPFVEAWPTVFAEQQQRQSTQWLTPWTFVGWQAPVTMEQYQHPPAAAAANFADEEEEEDTENSEYEYGFVLSDEWRTRFESSGRQHVQPQKPPRRAKDKKKRQQWKLQQKQMATAGAANASRSGHLQRELQAARTRELAKKWKRRSSGSGASATATRAQVEAMESSLNAVFDEFCDTFQPAVWPHDSLQ